VKKCQATSSCEQETESEEPSTRKAKTPSAEPHALAECKEETLAAGLLVKADEQENPNQGSERKISWRSGQPHKNH
jgi:hypothetical protein